MGDQAGGRRQGALTTGCARANIGLILDQLKHARPTPEAIMTEVGIYELKTRISEIVRSVQAGESFTVTRRGRPVCALVPLAEAAVDSTTDGAWGDFWDLARKIAQAERADPRTSTEILAEMRQSPHGIRRRCSTVE
jgi:prevent-host-death family protein